MLDGLSYSITTYNKKYIRHYPLSCTNNYYITSEVNRNVSVNVIVFSFLLNNIFNAANNLLKFQTKQVLFGTLRDNPPLKSRVK